MNCNLEKIWSICSKALLLSYVKYEPKVVEELSSFLPPTYQQLIQPYYKGILSQKLRDIRQDYERKPLNESILKEYLEETTDLLQWLNDNYEKVLPPDNLPQLKLLLLCTRITIVRDRWFSNKEKTKERGPFLPFLYTLFYIEMYINFWERYKKILPLAASDNEDVVEAIHGALDDFNLKDYIFVKDMETSNAKQIIRLWTGAKFHRIIQILIHAYTEGDIKLEEPSAQRLITELRIGLLDKTSLLCLTEIEDSPENLSGENANWFQSKETIQDENQTDFNYTGQNSYQALSKQVRDHMQKETEKTLKKHFQQDEIQAVKNSHETPEMILSVLIAQEKDLTIKDLEQDLTRLKAKKAILEKDCEGQSDEVYEVDFKELQIVNKHISKIEVILSDIKKGVLKELQKNDDETLASIDKILKGEKIKTKVTSLATPIFIRDTMFKVDQLMIWQFPSKERVIDIYDKHFIDIKHLLYKSICTAALRTNEIEFLANAETFTIAHTITQSEREYYRNLYSADSVFNSMDVCVATRDSSATVITNFPKTIKAALLNTTHEFYLDVLNFSTQWWLGQVLQKKDINQTIFFYEADLEFLSFDRIQLVTPVISKIAGKWCLILPDSWEYNYGINALWGDSNLLDVFTAWVIHIHSMDWKLYNYVTKELEFIKKSQIALLIETYLAQNG